MRKMMLGLVMVVMMLAMVGCGKDKEIVTNKMENYVSVTTVSDIVGTKDLFNPMSLKIHNVGTISEKEVEITGGIPGAERLLAELDNHWIIDWNDGFKMGSTVKVLIYDNGTPTIENDDVLIGYWK